MSIIGKKLWNSCAWWLVDKLANESWYPWLYNKEVIITNWKLFRLQFNCGQIKADFGKSFQPSNKTLLWHSIKNSSGVGSGSGSCNGSVSLAVFWMFRIVTVVTVVTAATVVTVVILVTEVTTVTVVKIVTKFSFHKKSFFYHKTFFYYHYHYQLPRI